ncbi:MAG: hypothetical protein IPM97_12890 [Bdellovibrionaceae bacterium]|nr:hypothetical protein [Pseudobdellovibrionaceae bacterium]
MRTPLLIVSMFFSATVMTQGLAAPTGPAIPPGPGNETIGAPGAPNPAPVPVPRKVSKKEAKAVCKAEGKKGKQLKTCVKEKSM